MGIEKVRFLEPGNPPYRRSVSNHFVYEALIRTPSHGLLTLATIMKERVEDTLMYSESISEIEWEDVLDADVIFIGCFTFAAPRAYEMARLIKQNSEAVVVLGGLHPSLNYPEAVQYCDYVLLGEADESILEFVDALESVDAAGPASTMRTRPATAKPDISLEGVAYLKDGKLVHTGERTPPSDIDTIPDRDLLHRYAQMVRYNTIWPQVHASRGCPHACDYCASVRHFGHRVRTRTPENVMADMRAAIAFHDRARPPRLLRMLWITDDNFFADREWAKRVLRAMIAEGFDYSFTAQARFEVGLDDELLSLLKAAGFTELSFGIEFIEDVSFEAYHKRSTKAEIVEAIRNTQAHGLNVRGLFILGADTHTKGVGRRLAQFVRENGIRGVLLQSMYFIPGTPVFENSKERLIHTDWSRYSGHVVHFPSTMTPAELQEEIIEASASIYSARALLKALLTYPLQGKILFIGESLWQRHIRKELGRELPYLESLAAAGPSGARQAYVARPTDAGLAAAGE